MSVSIQRLQEAIAAGDYDGMLAADSMFHEALGAASGAAGGTSGHVYSMVQRVRKALIAMPGRLEDILRAHIGDGSDLVAQRASGCWAIQTHDPPGGGRPCCHCAGHLVAVTDKSSRG